MVQEGYCMERGVEKTTSFGRKGDCNCFLSVRNEQFWTISRVKEMLEILKEQLNTNFKDSYTKLKLPNVEFETRIKIVPYNFHFTRESI